jgi:8-oxo-dGTP pyrophosphatase MutT (NUDIX family)
MSSKKIRFNYRSAGIVIVGGCVLAHTDPSSWTPHWALPGGHPELGEASADALRREFAEELAVDISIKRLVWVTEVFGGDEDGPFHEIALYYEVDLPAGSAITAHDGPFKGDGHDSAHLVFQWHALESLDHIRLLPTFLQRGLRELPENLTHLIHVDPG